ncbi:hypothetical protein [Lysobacter sp. Root667]|nr:hypothetical protein [Lysobacter sp. Root667]
MTPSIILGALVGILVGLVLGWIYLEWDHRRIMRLMREGKWP